jgi:hypothetical protein
VVHNNCLIIILLEHFVAHFCLQHTPESFDPYWPAGWLLIRISGGLLVLFVGPWQFWTGLCRTVPRIHKSFAHLIPGILDQGIMGIQVSEVETAQEARAIVRLAKYPPIGNRGISGQGPHTGYKSYGARHATEYAPSADENIIICPSSEVILRNRCSAPGLIRRFGTPTWANGPRERRRRA